MLLNRDKDETLAYSLTKNIPLALSLDKIITPANELLIGTDGFYSSGIQLQLGLNVIHDLCHEHSCVSLV